MKNQTQKSGEKALVNIHLQIPKRYLVLGLLSMALWQGCGKDEASKPAGNKAPVISQISKEAKLTFAQEEFSKEKLIAGIKGYLLENKKIIDEKPESVQVELLTDISKFTEGKTTMTFKVTDEKGQKSNEASIEVEIIKSQEAIHLPTEVEQLLPAKLEIQSQIDFSKIKAVTAKGQQVSPTKIAVNGQEVQTENYTFDTAETVEIIFTFSDDYTPATLKKTIQVHYKESAYGQFDEATLYDALGLTDWPEEAIRNNLNYGYFDALFALKYINSSLHKQIENTLRENAVGWRDIGDDMYYQDPRVEDSGNDGVNNDHSNIQIAGYFGDKGTSLLSPYDMYPKNGKYTVYAVNHGDDGVHEMTERNLREMVSAAPGDATIRSDWGEHLWVRWLNSCKGLAAKLAQGDFSLKIIFAPHDELVTYDEARKPEGVGKMISEIVALLENNLQSARHSMIFTFVRNGSESAPNGTMSEQFYKTFTNNGGIIVFAPSDMGRMYGKDSSDASVFIPEISTFNSNSVSGVGAIADYTVMSTVLKILTNNQNVNFDAFCTWYKDTEGYAQGWKLDYQKFTQQLYTLDKMPSAISLSGKKDFHFSDYLPQELLVRYNNHLRINTPLGWVKAEDVVSVAELKKYDFSTQTFSLGIEQSNGKVRKISDWNPKIQF